MKPAHRGARVLWLAMICIVCVTAFAPVARSQNAPSSDADKAVAPPLIQEMVGTWDVEQRMWPGGGAPVIELPSAVARRRLVEGAFLQEVMTPASESEQRSFTRIAYFNYNAVNQQYEYFSMDTRAPQMMIEKSYQADAQAKAHDQGEITLYGGSFVAPRWGEASNVAFRYRLVIGEVEEDRQRVQLYLTPQSGESVREFLAFEYVYTRQP